MYTFPQTVTPAAKNHIEAQLSYFNDVSKSLFRTAQQYHELNLQLAQTLLEESASTSQRIFTASRPTEALTAAASHAQPVGDKLGAYQQHVSRIAADTQANLAQVTEQHAVETSRTAKALAEEMARIAKEEADKGLRAQQEAARKFTDPFQQLSDAKGRQDPNDEARRNAGGQVPSNGTDGREHATAAQAAAAGQAAQASKQQGARRDS